MKTKRLKRAAGALFYMLVFGLTMWYVFRGQDLHRLWEYLCLADIRFILPAVAAVVGFILGESVILFHLLRFLGAKPSRFSCCLYSFIGFFFSAITPSASGGQPMQLLAMRREGIPSAVSCIVLAIVTIAYKMVLVAVGLLVMLLRPPSVMKYLAGVEGLMILGVVLNVIAVTVLLMMVFDPKLIRRGAGALMKLLRPLLKGRDPEAMAARLEVSLDTYHGASMVLKKSPLLFVQVFLVTLLQRFALFSVVWLTYLSFDFRQESGLVMTVLYAMISVAVDMLPLPGGMGISETLFLSIFTPVFGAVRVLPGMVISRGISYYTQLLISAVMTAASGLFLKKKTDTRT